MQSSWDSTIVPDSAGVMGIAASAESGYESAWLDGQAGHDSLTRSARHSLIAIRPLAVLEQTADQLATVRMGGKLHSSAPSAWELLRSFSAELGPFPPAPTPLAPGWIGYVGFEAASQLEQRVPARRGGFALPVVRLALFDAALVLDAQQRSSRFVTCRGVRERLGLPPRTSDDDRGDLERLCPPASSHRAAEPARSLRFLQTRREYLRRIERIREYIAAGDVYQVNYAQAVAVELGCDPVSAYLRLREANPAPYGALLRWPKAAVASVSPELLLEVHGGVARTRPIKGTRPRGRDPAADAASRRALLDSRKDAAELAMIVDLHRNDLGRVCEYGSVEVVAARAIETHPTIHHTVAEIAGRLRPECDALDALRACFPAGSISGVPKIRALQIIHELEPVPRGVYTGAIGVLGLDGSATFNVAIRTLQIHGNIATLHAGGGIVADSDPLAEYEETFAKMRGILRGLGVEAAIGDAPE